MGTQLSLTSGWILDSTTLLYHFHQEEPGMAAHPSLCAKVLLSTAAVRRHAGVRPQTLLTSYVTKNNGAAICQSCANRHANANRK